MAATGDGSTTYLSTAGTISPVTSAYSVAFWYKPASGPTAGATTIPFAFHNGGNTYVGNFSWNQANASFRNAWAHINAGATVDAVRLATTPSGVWIHIVITFGSSLMTIYLNGVQSATSAASAPSGSLGSPNIFVCAYASANSSDANPIAEAAIWNTALTAAQVSQLFNGATADTVGTGLVFYDKLNTGVATTTGPTLTNHGTTLNTTYFLGLSGGIAIGNSTGFNVQTLYKFQTDGGIAVGGTNMQVGSQAVFSSSMTLSGSSGRAPVFSAALTMTGAFPQPEQHGAFAATLAMQARLRCNSGSIANGRSMAYTTQ